MKMLLIIPLIYCAASTGASAQTGPDHAHDHHATASQHAHSATPAAADRWQSDQPLRLGMARVRAASEALAAQPPQAIDAEQVRTVAKDIRAAVDTIFAECKLAPEPDAALHPLLAALIGASHALDADPNNLQPKQRLDSVLERYSELFVDEGSATP